MTRFGWLRRVLAGGLIAVGTWGGPAAATAQERAEAEHTTVAARGEPAPQIITVIDTIVSSYGSCPTHRGANSLIGLHFYVIPTKAMSIRVDTYVAGRGWFYGRWERLVAYHGSLGTAWAIALGPNPPARSSYINRVSIAVFNPWGRYWSYGNEYVPKSGSSNGWCVAR